MKLFSNIMGQGPPLIIMHGVFGMGDNWKTLGRKWAEDYEVHLLDMRNHGRSPHSDEFSYQVMSKDLKKYLDEHNLKKALILGHSMGGKVGMLFATQNPKRTEKLVVADIAPKPYDPHHGPILDALHSLDLHNLQTRKEAQDAFAKIMPDLATRQFLLKSLHYNDQKQLAWRFNLPALDREVRKRGEYLAESAIFEGPTLFARGEKSKYIKDGDEVEIQKHFPKARLETIAGANHWVHASKPQEFFEMVNSFLQEPV